MIIRRLDFENYRNLKAGQMEPHAGVNLISGPNAQGKTNLLEAIWLFTGGRSFRGAKDADLVLRGERRAEVNIGFFCEEREQTAQIAILNGRRNAVLNGVPLKRASGLIGRFFAVLFSPEHLSLVREGPSFRRNFIDAALCQVKPGYAALLSRYNRTLVQRNALLKEIPRHSALLDTLDVWDERLAALGESVMKGRAGYLEKIRGPAQKIYAGISQNKENIQLEYQKSAEDLKQALYASRRDDIATGHTNFGPHRDDMEITIDSLSARTFGSQGQKRSVVLALKLAEAELLFRETGERPVILLDDVMSELDSGRQDYLLNHLTDCQVFITCCEPDAVKQLRDGILFFMDGGVLSKK
ncbi:DNA replication/repair protein RecF [Caproiciproducens galactitolivorans]|uniref:DNA replication and repair protein RecF n=1 Tax=Caproiciproducens galactitolivorans TaxID=642589 RepID=A0A4Z0YJ34_9FIRM|nr:DNA replication/repair protein RecF [Caproiciproducens galactitolivorans]TGJ76892.1 DNA replication and repair protein RecF [Caproiciproducens galactitolivorans]